MLFAAWIYGEQTRYGQCFQGCDAAAVIDASKMFDLAPQMPPVDWAKGLAHLPEGTFQAVGGRRAFMRAMPVRPGDV